MKKVSTYIRKLTVTEIQLKQMFSTLIL